MEGKQLTIEDVIRQLNGVINSTEPQQTPKRLLINASQMAVVRQMMDASLLANGQIRPAGKEVYEKEEPDEVPQVQRNDNSK
jgi:hypothetical protein